MAIARPKDITFGSQSFSAGPLVIAYDAVNSIRFEYIAVKVVPYGGTTHHPEMEIFVKNQTETIRVRLPRRFIASAFTHTAARASEVVSAYEELAQRTFAYRLAWYSEQIEHTGGFTYDGKRFMVDGMAMSTTGKPIMNIRNRKLFRYPDRVECHRAEGAAAQIDRFVPMVAPAIKTAFDRDVFFILLDHLYGIRW
jgi:hypothetical protein